MGVLILRPTAIQSLDNIILTFQYNPILTNDYREILYT